MVKLSRILLATALLLSTLLTACAIEPELTDAHTGMADVDPALAMAGHEHPMALLEGMPDYVQTSDARTQEAYRFAVANPDAAREVPCYCGCVGLGHASSYDCYVAGEEGGALAYDNHAANCAVCVNITQDQMRLMDGDSPPEAIRVYLEENYSQYGPPTEWQASGQ
jgi:hypothetical protein